MPVRSRPIVSNRVRRRERRHMLVASWTHHGQPFRNRIKEGLPTVQELGLSID